MIDQPYLVTGVFVPYCSSLTKKATLDSFVTDSILIGNKKDENGESPIFLDIQILPSGTFQGRSFVNRWLRGVKTLVTNPRLYITETFGWGDRVKTSLRSWSDKSLQLSNKWHRKPLKPMGSVKVTVVIRVQEKKIIQRYNRHKQVYFPVVITYYEGFICANFLQGRGRNENQQEKISW